MLKRIALSAFVLVGVGLLALIAMNPMPVTAHKDAKVDRKIEMTWGEMFYQVKEAAKNAPITVKAGELVKFVIKNEGKAVHEMHIGRKANTKDELYDEPLFADGYDSLWLGPGQSAELVLRIPDKPGEGSWAASTRPTIWRA